MFVPWSAYPMESPDAPEIITGAAEPDGVVTPSAPDGAAVVTAPEPTAPRLSPEPNPEIPDPTPQTVPGLVVEPEPVVVTPDAPDEEEDEELVAFDADLPTSLHDAHVLIVKLRKSYDTVTKNNRKRRERMNLAESSVTRLTDDVAKLTTKLETVTSERDAAIRRAEAADATQAEASTERERIRQYWLEKFTDPIQREIADRTQTDLLPKLLEQFNPTKVEPKAPEPAPVNGTPPPSQARQVVTRTAGAKPKPTTFKGYFNDSGGRK